MRVLLLSALLLCCAVAQSQTPAPLPASLDLQTLNPGNNLPGTVGVRHAGDGSDRLFAIVRTGQVRIFDASRTLLPMPFLDIVANPPALGFQEVSGGGSDERGMLGLAFHPTYASNGRVYIYYLDDGSNSVVAEYKVSPTNANVVDPATERVILRVYQPFSNHNGGDIHFGPDGYLYVGLGDGGSGNDPCNSGQSLTSAQMSNSGSCVPDASFTDPAPAGVPRGQATSRALLGKMLRIDVDSTDTPANADLCGADPANRRYGIPSDNPFAGNAGSNRDACDEIYHYGLRNPFRFSFDRETHDLVIGDVGQNAFEEMDLVGPAGGVNFGWKTCEGFHRAGSTTVDCPLASATDPILAYGRSFGVSITGGFRYRGPFHALDGVLFFADAYGARIFFAREDGGAWPWAIWRNNAGSVVGFGEDEGGNLYLTTLNGAVQRFTMGSAVVLRKAAALATDANGDGIADAGDVITYTVTVLNGGSTALDSIVVVDEAGDAAPVTLTCPASLAVGATGACTTYDYTVTQDDIDAGASLVNVATVTAADPGDAVVTATAQASVAVATAAPALDVLVNTGLDDANDNGVADVGESITYVYYLANTGNVTLEQIALESSQSGTLACEFDPLGVLVSAHCGSDTITVQQADIDAGELRNIVEASAVAPGGAAVTDTLTLDTPVTAAAVGLELEITATLTTDIDGDGLVDAGDTVRYGYTLFNTGTVTLDTLRVTATRHSEIACAAPTLAPQANVDCGPVDHVVTADDIVAGRVRNEATAHGLGPDDQVAVSDVVAIENDADRPAAIFADGFEDD